MLGQAHQAGSRPQAGHPRQQDGALHAEVAPHHQHLAVAPLVGRARARGQQRLEAGIVYSQGGRNNALRWRHTEAVAVEPTDPVHPVSGQHALLDADEGEGAGGSYQGAHGATGVGIEPGGQVHRQHGGLQGIDCCDNPCHCEGEGNMDTGAEQRVYHQIRWHQ
ncbi:hypothetical protein D3C79_720080 [compost metagenome]